MTYVLTILFAFLVNLNMVLNVLASVDVFVISFKSVERCYKGGELVILILTSLLFLPQHNTRHLHLIIHLVKTQIFTS